MIKKLTAMPHRTPILAIILAPVALYLLVQLWAHALVPLYRATWYSDTVLKWRLDSDEPAIRIQAAKDVGLRRAKDAALFDELAASVKTDKSVEVRKASAASLGQLGAQRPLSEAAIQALSSLVLTEPDHAMQSVVIVAVGQSAANNRYPDSVVERIAAISSEKRQAWEYPRSASALGLIGANQPLPDTVIAVMNTQFTHPRHSGEREDLVNAFVEIAKGGRLPATTLDLLAAAFEAEPNHRIRKAILYALAHGAENYPPSITLLTAATSDPDKSIVSTAEHGLSIVEYNRTLADKDPLSAAMNTAEPVTTRLNALRIVRSTRIDPAAYESIVALAQDSEAKVAIAAIDMFPHMVRSADADFDRRILIPALSQAMSDTNPLIRYAAHGALSGISRNRPAYLRAADIPGKLDAGANDPDPKVRVVVLLVMLRHAGAAAERDAIVARGMTDPDPYVRGMAAGWLGSPRIETSQRQEFIAQALDDPDPDVRRSAAAAQQDWAKRERAWPIKLWQQWQAGERGKVGMKVLIAVTVATPVLICGVFLFYYMARLLTYLQQRRWRAAALLPVIATWVGASYGMFMLYFAAGHTGNLDTGETAVLTSVLWGAIAAYAALGWGMHFAVRR